jgi:hypothetical protein
MTLGWTTETDAELDRKRRSTTDCGNAS